MGGFVSPDGHARQLLWEMSVIGNLEGPGGG